jgi:hypothetical protein
MNDIGYVIDIVALFNRQSCYGKTIRVGAGSMLMAGWPEPREGGHEVRGRVWVLVDAIWRGRFMRTNASRKALNETPSGWFQIALDFMRVFRSAHYSILRAFDLGRCKGPWRGSAPFDCGPGFYLFQLNGWAQQPADYRQIS